MPSQNADGQDSGCQNHNKHRMIEYRQPAAAFRHRNGKEAHRQGHAADETNDTGENFGVNIGNPFQAEARPIFGLLDLITKIPVFLLVQIPIVHVKGFSDKKDLLSPDHVTEKRVIASVQQGFPHGRRCRTQNPCQYPTPKQFFPAKHRQLPENSCGKEHRHIGGNGIKNAVQCQYREKPRGDPVQNPDGPQIQSDGFLKIFCLFHP